MHGSELDLPATATVATEPMQLRGPVLDNRLELRRSARGAFAELPFEHMAQATLCVGVASNATETGRPEGLVGDLHHAPPTSRAPIVGANPHRPLGPNGLTGPTVSHEPERASGGQVEHIAVRRKTFGPTKSTPVRPSMYA